ncbi:MAG: hypothetical protein EXS14_03120 [Planctomycetes bacterium]|nr:hypothetical protein [Planctomycetota bacterium]
MDIDPALLDLLRCPESRAPLVLDGTWLVSTDGATRRRYRIEAGIPDMILDDSEVLSEADWAQVMQRAGVGRG